MKRTPKKPPKPATAAELAAEERQRMISSDLEQIRRYIGEIASILKGYREENVALRAELQRRPLVNGVSVALVAENMRLLSALSKGYDTAMSFRNPVNGEPQPCWTELDEVTMFEAGEVLRAAKASNGQAAAQASSPPVDNYARNIGIPPILRPQDFAAEQPDDN